MQIINENLIRSLSHTMSGYIRSTLMENSDYFLKITLVRVDGSGERSHIIKMRNAFEADLRPLSSFTKSKYVKKIFMCDAENAIIDYSPKVPEPIGLFANIKVTIQGHLLKLIM